MRWHRNKKGKRPIAKEGLLFRRTNGELTSPAVETEHLGAGTLEFIGQKRKLWRASIISRYIFYSFKAE